MTSKKHRHDQHALQRASERFGLTISPRNLQKAAEDIRSGRARFFDTDSCTRTKWVVELGGKDCIVVYSKTKKAIVTILPEAAYFGDRPSADHVDTGDNE